MNAIRNDEFLERIQYEIEINQLKLPTLPDVAIKVRTALSDEDVNVEQIADIIATDAAVSARLIQVANSPLYRGRAEIIKLPMAISRLGTKSVRSLVTTLVMQQVFNPQSKVLAQYFRETWEQSVSIASVARALATRCPHLDADQAMLAGLIHQIGKLPILMWAESEPDLIEDQQSMDDALESLHPKVSKIILESWKFPDSLTQVVTDYLDFQRQSSGNDADYVDIVQVAYLESLPNGDGSQNLDWTNVQAFRKLGLEPEIEILEIEGVADQVEEAQNLLNNH